MEVDEATSAARFTDEGDCVACLPGHTVSEKAIFAEFRSTHGAAGEFSDDSRLLFKVVVDILEQESRIDRIHKMIVDYYGGPTQKKSHLSPIKVAVQAMEAMINEGWVIAKIDKKSAKMAINRPEENDFIHMNRDEDPAASKTMD